MLPQTEGLLAEFLLEARERLERLEEALLAAGPGGTAPARLEEVRRELHTLKGNAGLMGFDELQALAHAMEDALESGEGAALPVAELLGGIDRFRVLLDEVSGAPARAAGAASETARSGVRITFARLDALVDLLAEMVIFRNRLEESLVRARRAAADPAAARPAWREVEEAQETLGKTLDQLQEGVLRLRMVPLRTLFRQLGRIVHDEAAREGREVRFETTGGETPLDKALLELSSEALGHLLRNAVVHGLEPAEERRRAGKGPGVVRLRAEADAREVRIDVEDDGRGIAREAVLAAAASRGHPLAPGQDPLALLFLPGFTTREGVDLSAGRGIGLAAVQEAVHRRGGRIEVTSREGAGTRFRLRLPLSVSITRALLLSCDGEAYVLPMASVVESVALAPGAVHEINDALVLAWRGDLVPLLDLGTSFGTASERRRAGTAVVIEGDGARRAVAADRLHGIREVVVKGLDDLLGAPPGIAGSTILGDGRAVLILDPAGLMRLSPFQEAAA
ncbi:MAG TPA: chemotaxis protein CheW [Thermoanaerobaculia bacterium]|nr:chemotaxis protein CheW [Thermoanaerobaculia bacterium]